MTVVTGAWVFCEIDLTMFLLSLVVGLVRVRFRFRVRVRVISA